MLLGCIRKKKIKRASALILALIISVSSIIGAVFTVPISVFALSAGGIHTTIASIILSLLLQTGAAPVNQTWVSSLNNAYGYTVETAISEGLLTESAGGLIDSGLASSIEGSAAYGSLGLGDIFTTTAADGAGVMAASGGVNIANTAIHVGTAGTIGSFAGAVAVGVGAGVLINHVREKLGKYIKYGFGMNIAEDVVNNVQFGRVNYYQRIYNNNSTPIYLNAIDCENGIVGAGYRKGYGYGSLFKNISDTSKNYTTKNYVNDNLNNNPSIKSLSSGNTISGPSISNNAANKLVGQNFGHIYDTEEEAQNYLDSLTINDIPHVTSPDIIGPEGNQFYDSENDTFPGLVNQIPEGSDMVPVNMDDYQTYINNANNNTDNGDTGQPVQGEAFEDLIDSLIVAAPTIPDTPIIPDQPVDVPVVPNRPVTPDQPTMPDKPGLTDQEIQDALNGVTTIDLRSIFPFCIPFDLYNILLIFDTGENRKAPHITFTFPFTDWVIDVDLAPFDPVAGILRLLELILFIIGLAVATRRLIGAGGG